MADVAATVMRLVADRLAVKPGTVSLESRLVEDLGADSLDFVDLLFTLEKEFGIVLHEGDLDVMGRLDFSSPEVMRDGYLTPAAVARLTRALPELLTQRPDLDRLTPAHVFAAITVGTLCRMVEARLGA
jgi:acyl carrier protein